MNNKKEKRNLLADRRVMVFLSLLTAVVMWSMVTLNADPEHTQTIYNVDVMFTYDSSKYTSLGLDVVNQPQVKANVQITGKRSEVVEIKEEDLIVYPDYSLVKGPGTMDLPLKVKVQNTSLADRVTATTDQTVSVVFDAIEEKTFDVVVELDDVSIAEGYVLHGTLPAPAKVTVRGPESEIAKIDRIVAPVTGGDELKGLEDSKIATVTLEPRDANNNPIELRYATSDNTLADVNITVYQTAEVPLTVNFINVPQGFDLSTLDYTLSQKTMLVSGKPSVIRELTELSVSDFDLSTFALDKAYQLNINMPKEVQGPEKLTTVTLSFNTEQLISKTFTIPERNIRVINKPANIEIKPTLTKLSNVTLIGPADVLKDLGPGSVVAVINADDCQITEGSENLPVSIQVPALNSVFAVGNYSMECVVQSKGGQA